jgi:hypothetical protein
MAGEIKFDSKLVKPKLDTPKIGGGKGGYRAVLERQVGEAKSKEDTALKSKLRAADQDVAVAEGQERSFTRTAAAGAAKVILNRTNAKTAANKVRAVERAKRATSTSKAKDEVSKTDAKTRLVRAQTSRINASAKKAASKPAPAPKPPANKAPTPKTPAKKPTAPRKTR